MEDLTKEENLKIENEVLKLKLQTENPAAQMHIASGLDPEVENKWLNYIFNFEKTCKEAPKRSVYELMGEPAFINEAKLSDHEVELALHHLMEIMSTSKVRLHWLEDEYKPRTLYKFITEEFFNEMVDDVDIDGLMHMFNYEEFHPNHAYDMAHHTETFLECILSGHDWSKFNPVFMANEIHSHSGEPISKKDLIEIIQMAQEKNHSAIMTSFKLDKVEFDEQAGQVDFTLKYSSSTFSEEKITSGHLGFTNFYGFYEINEVYIPGLLVI